MLNKAAKGKRPIEKGTIKNQYIEMNSDTHAHKTLIHTLTML